MLSHEGTTAACTWQPQHDPGGNAQAHAPHLVSCQLWCAAQTKFGCLQNNRQWVPASTPPAHAILLPRFEAVNWCVRRAAHISWPTKLYAQRSSAAAANPAALEIQLQYTTDTGHSTKRRRVSMQLLHPRPRGRPMWLFTAGATCALSMAKPGCTNIWQPPTNVLCRNLPRCGLVVRTATSKRAHT